MGHREDLLAGAKRCLYERGYARTTARDIVAASGTNLASIGYHFGSKDELLNTALVEAIDEWSDRLVESLAKKRIRATDPLARFEVAWKHITDSFDAHRPLWVALFEALAQAEHSPRMRRFLAGAMQHGRERIAASVERVATASNAARARTTGAFFQALMMGVMAQWLVDPARAPSGRDLGAALRAILATVAPARRG